MMNVSSGTLRTDEGLEVFVDGILGEGGEGSVCSGTAGKVPVAVKIIDDQSDQRRFKRTAALYESLFGVPHMPNYLGCGKDRENRQFMVFERVFGNDLGKLLEEQEFYKDGDYIDKALRITIDVCNALHELHKKGIVHRDVKPSNIMIEGSETILIDMSCHSCETYDDKDSVYAEKAEAEALKKLLDPRLRHLTETGRRVGTLLYMAPEQFKTLGGASVRSDIYGVGCVLYEMLASKGEHRTVFDDIGDRDVVIVKMWKDASDIREHNKEIDNRLSEIVAKCLDKNPEKRYGSVTELKQDIEVYRRSKEGVVTKE